MITKKRKISQIPSTTVLNANSKILVIHEGATATISALDIISGISVISADHLSDFNNPHNVTKTQLGLENVNNTSDLNKPISTSTQIALDTKQATLVSGINIKTVNGQSLLGSGDVGISFPITSVNNKSGEVQLDTTDIPEGANLYYTSTRVEQLGDSRYVSLNGSYGNPSWLTSIDWSKIDSKPSSLAGYNILDPIILASGNYINPSWIGSLEFTKLTSVPNFATTLNGLEDVVLNSPQNYQILMFDGTKWKNADNLAETRLAFLSDTDINSPANLEVLQYNGTKWVNQLIPDTATWGNISGTLSTQTDLQNALNAKEAVINPGLITDYYRGDKTFAPLNKTAVGLGNVDNTSDVNKPISTATQTALNAKEASIIATSSADYYRGDKTFQPLNKTAVGLSNVDNTSDLNKPISTATQTALNNQETLSIAYAIALS